MRVAALYDVHGNLPALEAVLAELETLASTVVVVGGDAILGPMPGETLDVLLSLGERLRFLRGNTEREILEGDPGAGGLWAERTAWAGRRLSAEHRSLLAALPERVVVEIDGVGPTLFCHGSPRRDDEIVTRLTPESRLVEILAGVDQPVVVCGHTHVQFDRMVGGIRLVNAGSVGMPYEREPGAYWALLGPDVELRRTAYDLDAAAARIRTGGLPGAEEFVQEYVLNRASPWEASERFEELSRSSR